VPPNEQGSTAAGFLSRAVAWCASLGITVERILSDNGACYRSKAHAITCQQHSIRHHFTRPYRPRTNGKAERFIQSLTHRWAYEAIHGSSTERATALPGWLTHYNYTRRHGSLSHKPPGTRLRELTNCWELQLVLPAGLWLAALGPVAKSSFDQLIAISEPLRVAAVWRRVDGFSACLQPGAGDALEFVLPHDVCALRNERRDDWPLVRPSARDPGRLFA
jgi:hypothetical protein